MNQNKEAMPLPRSGAITEIPGPYLSPEQTESYPLQAKQTAGRLGACSLCCFWPCCPASKHGVDTNSGLRPVIACFFTFSLALTVALVLQIRLGEPQVIPHGSVASDSRECSQIGASILKKGGNAVDAAVATTICLGVVLPHVTGIGGGGFIAIYDHRHHRVVDAIDFREQAAPSITPGAQGNASTVKRTPWIRASTVGIPGFLKGLGLAHELHGRLPWAEVIKPTINLCRLGFLVPSSLISARSQLPASSNKNLREDNPLFWERFGSLEAGRDMTDLKMASTLQVVADEGPQALYNGSLTRDFLETVAESGGSVSQGDLFGYKAIRRSLIRVPFGPASWVYSMGSPSGGPLLLSALNLIDTANQQSGKGASPEPDATTNDSISGSLVGMNTSDATQEDSSSTTKEPLISEKNSNVSVALSDEGKASFGSTEDSSKEVSASPAPKEKVEKMAPVTKIPIQAPKLSQGSKETRPSKFQKGAGKDGVGKESVVAVGKATVVPYDLGKKRKRRMAETSEDDGTGLDQSVKSAAEESFEEMESLLEALKDASLLHSLQGDPRNSACANDDHGLATNPMEKLKMLQRRLSSSDEALLLQNIQEPLRPAGSNVAVVDSNELYVSVVSGLGSWFGSQILTSRGYLLNDALMDFYYEDGKPALQPSSGPSVPPSPGALSLQLPSIPPVFPSLKGKMAAIPNHKSSQSQRQERISKRSVDGNSSVLTCNGYGSGKRPLSSSVVAFVVPRTGFGTELPDGNGLEQGVGACGQRIVLGSADALSVTQVLVQILLKGSSLVEGIEYTRVKPLASSVNYGIEVGPETIKWGDDVSKESATRKGLPLPQPYASVNGIEEIADTLASHADSRGGGVAARF